MRYLKNFNLLTLFWKYKDPKANLHEKLKNDIRILVGQVVLDQNNI